MTSRSYLLLCPALFALASCTDHAGGSTAPEEMGVSTAHLIAIQGPADVGYANRIAQAIRSDGKRALKPAEDVPNNIELSLPVGAGAPVYANLYHGFLPNDGTTAGLSFFRDPDCVRPDFNLLDWIDVPFAWDCPLVPGLSGSQWLASMGSPPFALEIRFRPVIYFVDHAVLLEAVADGVLTIGELNSLPTLRIGEACRADLFTINSFAPAPFGDGNGHEWFTARGRMRLGGASFLFAYEEVHVFDPVDQHIFPRSVTYFHHAGPDECDG